jgi:hypothetical protein
MAELSLSDMSVPLALEQQYCDLPPIEQVNESRYLLIALGLGRPRAGIALERYLQ